MKLSKTEAQLIEKARYYGGSYGVQTCYGRGPSGGRVQYGTRERNAVYKLVERGLAMVTNVEPWQDYNRGYGQGGNVISFKLV